MSKGLQVAEAGCVIRELREERGVSLRQLAIRLGWDRGRLSKYETNRLALSLPVLEEISRALGEQPEVVVLRCITKRYPSLTRSEPGRLIKELVRGMAPRNRSM